MPGSRAIRVLLIFLLATTTALAAGSLGERRSRNSLGAQGAVSLDEASRFLAQATLGANLEQIQRTAGIGFRSWLDDQFRRPIGYHQPLLDSRRNLGFEVENDHRRWVWWQQVMDGPDPLRQRIGFALSEIFVVSDALSDVRDSPLGMANYYDMLLENSFGNFRDLLYDVTMHPIMGVYLSHLKNEKSNPARNRFPDENYAREIMQLFSVGLFELQLDGTVKTDGSGRPIPTYDNSDITEFAKIFTGLGFASPAPSFRSGEEVWTRPMRMYEAYHEPGAKQLLRGQYVPPGQTGMQDINAAIDNLFHHPNVGPFIARRLIQRLVSSNPSPAYIRRVASTFNNNGSGVRGDMKSVITAILLDPEARAWPNRGDITSGRLRESFLRRVHFALAFDAASLARVYPIDDPNAPTNFGQRPLSSPTVFNFFLPDHQPAGPIANAGLFAPEFQVITTVTAIASANELRTQIDRGLNFSSDSNYEVTLDLSDEIALAQNVPVLIDRLDLILMHGTMSPQMRQILIQALQRLEDPVERTKMALHLIAISPEYAVIR